MEPTLAPPAFVAPFPLDPPAFSAPAPPTFLEPPVRLVAPAPAAPSALVLPLDPAAPLGPYDASVTEVAESVLSEVLHAKITNDMSVLSVVRIETRTRTRYVAQEKIMTDSILGSASVHRQTSKCDRT